MLSGPLLYRFPVFPVRSIIRKNLDFINYLKVSFLNARNFSFRIEIIREKGIWVFDDWSGNYFHWTFDVLPKLFTLGQSDDCKNILLPEQLLKFAYVTETLGTLGYKITALKSNTTYVAKEIVSHQNVPYFSKEALSQIRETVFKSLPTSDKQHSNQNIYVSRNKATRRKIMNEKELLLMLSDYHFKTVYLEDMTWQEQVLLFRNSNLVVSMHGAGLSNVLYGEKMKGVIELRPSSSQNGLFRLLAEECSIPYRQVTLFDPNKNIHDQNFMLDDEALKMVKTCIIELTKV
jgi:capsular polysaccharide biosynthesis protein